MATSEALERIQEQVGGQVVDQVVGTFYKEKVYLEAYSAKVDKRFMATIRGVGFGFRVTSMLIM